MLQIDLHKVPNKRIIALIIYIFSVILAPYWFIFQFSKDLFIKTDLIPLLLVCLSVGFPVALFNLLMISIIIKDNNDAESETVWFNRLTWASLCTIFVFYCPSIKGMGYLYANFLPRSKIESVSLKTATSMAVLIQWIFIIIQLIFILFSPTNSNQKKEITQKDKDAQIDVDLKG